MQGDYRLNAGRIRRLTARLLQLAIKGSRRRPWGDLSVVFTNDAGIEAVNRLHLSRLGSTDVISFRYLPMPGEGRRLSGEVIVNVHRAVTAATARRGWSASQELSLYIAHGINHLAGGRDSTVAQRAQMRRRELRWLREAATRRQTRDLIRCHAPGAGRPR